MVRENKTECKMTFRNEEPHVNKCFPRVRGDVPNWKIKPRNGFEFSPRARGCSAAMDAHADDWEVFPACAGMFLEPAVSGGELRRFPRVRGDVPDT